jgi:hypothetical protein
VKKRPDRKFALAATVLIAAAANAVGQQQPARPCTAADGCEKQQVIAKMVEKRFAALGGL